METIFVAALKEETPKLSKFHHTGVGKINASIKLMELINVYKPNQIINYGTAGSFKKEISGLIECTSFVQHDMDARGLLDFKLGETPFDPISKIILSDKGYICATGDRFVKNNPLIYDRLQLLKPTMPEITKITKKIIKNFGPK